MLEFRPIAALQSDDPSTAKAAIISINQSERGQQASSQVTWNSGAICLN